MSWKWFKTLIKNQPAQIAAYAVLLAFTATQFTNCGGFSTPGEARLSSVSCTSATCITPVPENLKITPLLGNAGSYFVASGISLFTIAGLCNEGGFPGNVVRWELIDDNGASVRSSDSGVAWNGTSYVPLVLSCLNGHFSALVNVGAAGDGKNPAATGLPPGYTVRFFFYGKDASGTPTPPVSSTVPLAV